MSFQKTQSYDIIIIGAGPAGANFARIIDSRKYSILLVDGSVGREKVCAGLISPDAQDILARYNMTLPDDALISPQLFSVRTIDLKDGYTRYYRRSYINANRAKFDEFFRRAVPETVSVITGKCKAVTRTKDGFDVEIFSDTLQKYSCKYIIGADGSSSVIRRTLFGNKKIHRYTAIQQSFKADGETPYYSCVFDNDTSNGCSWIFFKGDKLIFGGAFQQRDSRQRFEAQKEKLVRLGIVPKQIFEEPTKTQACSVSRPSLSGGVFLGDSRAFLIGEAAGLISPSSFEGISYALASSEALADAFNKKETAAYRAYRRKTVKLRIKIILRCIKCPFMYNRYLRRLVMKSGITSIKLKEE